MYYDWLRVDGLGVYAGSVVLCNSDYICNGETGEIFALGKWDPNNPNSQFIYAGQAGTGTKQIRDITFWFPGSGVYTDVVVIFRSLAVDYVAGILSDGREVSFNYTFDSSGVLVPGSNFMETWQPGGDLSPLADQSHTREKIVACGIAGIVPDGNFSLANGGVLFRLPKVSYDELNADPNLWGSRGLEVYELIGIRVVYQSPTNVPAQLFCPPR